MEIKIAKSFRIFASKIKVRMISDLRDRTGLDGLTTPRRDMIFIQTDCDGVKKPKSQIEEIYLHEITHQIFLSINRPDLCQDENLVILFARALHQVLKTSKY